MSTIRGDQLQRGAVVGGYRIDELISRGGMGIVYRARHIALNRVYALKILAPELAEDVQFRDRFKREMRIAASLHHPNIVEIHYAGEHEGLLFFVMDFVTGTDLREILHKYGALDPGRAVDLLLQLGSALDAAHARGLVHRDVKPANILITVQRGEENAYLTDFGLARRYDAASALTKKGLVVGTVDYMAPEQITGDRVDARADIYGLGCVFYQMLTGAVPYERENSVATLFAQVNDPPPPLQGEVAGTHPALAAVIEKAMAKDPSDRYLSAGDFAYDAEASLTGARHTGQPTIVGVGDATPLPRSFEGEETPGSPTTGEAGETTASSVIGGAGEGTEPSTVGAAGETAVSPTIGEAGDTTPPATIVPAGDASSPRSGESREAPQPKVRADAPVTAVAVAADGTPPVDVTPPSGMSGQGPGGPPGPGSKVTAEGDGPPDGAPKPRKRGLLPALAALVLIAAAIAAVIIVNSGGSSKPAAPPLPPGQKLLATTLPVPDNQVTGNGTATVVLRGDTVTVTLDTNGLLNAVHAMHIHAGGLGACPPASAAHAHNGHQAIDTVDGLHWYGPPQVSLTESGDTNARSLQHSILAFSRYPASGNIRYQRTFAVPPGIAAAIRANNGVIVVHGIDYNHNGVYDDVLGQSQLNPGLPSELTAPALCGPLVGSASASVHGQGTSGTVTYVAMLQRPVSSPAAPVFGFPLLCHLLGATVSSALTGSRVTARAT